MVNTPVVAVLPFI